MDPDTFEQLISEWLDSRHDPALRARLDAAIAAEPHLAAVLDEWQTFDRQLRAGMPVARGIVWARFRQAVSAAVDTAIAKDAALDAALRCSPTVEATIDWPRMRVRISAAIDAEASRVNRTRTRRLWLGGAAASALTAAAALVVALLPDRAPEPGAAGGGAIARAVISAPAVSPAGGVAMVSITGGEAPAAPQALFMIDPPRSSANDTPAGYF